MICKLFWSRAFFFSDIFYRDLLTFRKISDAFRDPMTVKVFGVYPYLYFWKYFFVDWIKCSLEMFFFYFIVILAFFKLLPVSLSKSLFTWFNDAFIVVAFEYILNLLALLNSFNFSQNHVNMNMVCYICFLNSFFELARSLVLIDLQSETKGSWFEFNC